LNIKGRDGINTERAVVTNVPLMFPSSSMSAFSFPVNKGDNVLLVYSQRGLDTFKQGNGLPSTPVDYRSFGESDCIAIPGIFPFAKSVNLSNSNPLDTVMRHNVGTASECEVRLRVDGEIQLNSPLLVKINAPDSVFNSNLQVNGTIDSTGNITSLAKVEGSTVKSTTNNVTLHTHNHGSGPAPTPGT
jgi:hypothetical protein